MHLSTDFKARKTITICNLSGMTKQLLISLLRIAKPHSGVRTPNPNNTQKVFILIEYNQFYIIALGLTAESLQINVIIP